MNTIQKVALFLAVIGQISVAYSETANTVACPEDEKALRHIKTTLWNQAYRQQDVALLGELLDDSFQMFDNAGNRSNKQKELDWIANNQWDPGEFEYQVDRLDIYGCEFAIVDGTGIASEYTYKSSNVLIKRAGKWRAVHSHVSGFTSLEN